MFASRLLLTSVILAPAALASAGTIDKQPDIGSYWSGLSSTGSTVYANSFIAPTSAELSVQSLGIWLKGGSSEVRFQILADNANKPDGASILSTSAINAGTYSNLTLVTLPMSSLMLVAGQRYWAAASTVGLGGSGEYQVGGHTQNSGGISDNGTFWYSNDVDGLVFAGQDLNPEMAFQVNLGGNVAPVPEPATIAALALGGISLVRRRRKG